MKEKKQALTVKQLVTVSMFIAITVILSFTPLGTIRLPIVSITIAHVPAIIAAIVFGLYEGVLVALSFGIISLIRAITSPATILDPFFVNPLISILPRVLIPVTAWLVYHGLMKWLRPVKYGETIAIAVSAALGNLTNTFGVYTMLYLVYARQILEKSGTPALSLIITAISTTTLIKCVGIVIIAIPVIYALQKFKKFSAS